MRLSARTHLSQHHRGGTESPGCLQPLVLLLRQWLLGLVVLGKAACAAIGAWNETWHEACVQLATGTALQAVAPWSGSAWQSCVQQKINGMRWYEAGVQLDLAG